MGNLSKHFDSSEFACKCGCGFQEVEPELIAALELVRTHVGKPVYITSGCRCPQHNEKVGGAPNSRHLVGEAADIWVKDFPSRVIGGFLDAMFPESYGIGLYDSWVHIDVRSTKARWEG